MESLIFKAAAIGITAVMLAASIKKESPVFAGMITLAAGVLIFFMVLPKLSAALDVFNTVAGKISSGTEYVATVIKIIGIAYVSEFGASVCADAGETGVASRIELAGKVLIMAASAPVVLTLLNRALAILG